MKKKFLIPAILILALLVGGILWYTRPVSFWEATGMDRDQITGASGVAIENSIQDGDLSTQTWKMDNLTSGQEDHEALLALLEDTTCRSSLRNLLPPASSYSSDAITAQITFSLGDQLVTVNAHHTGQVLISSPGDSRTLAFSVSPRELNETLADFIQQRGVPGDT